jgi:hypothetical protein
VAARRVIVVVVVIVIIIIIMKKNGIGAETQSTSLTQVTYACTSIEKLYDRPGRMETEGQLSYYRYS